MSFLGSNLIRQNHYQFKDGSNEFQDALIIAMAEKDKYQHLSSTIDTLISWMEHDVLNKAGSHYADREFLYNFIVDEFKKIESIESHRIREVRITLENKKISALAFVNELSNKFDVIAARYSIPIETVWDICKNLRCAIDSDRYAIESWNIQETLGDVYDDISIFDKR